MFVKRLVALSLAILLINPTTILVYGLEPETNSTNGVEIPQISQEEIGSSENYEAGEIIVVLEDSSHQDMSISTLEEELDRYAEVASVQENPNVISTLSSTQIDNTTVESFGEEILPETTLLVDIPEELTVTQALAIAEETDGVACAYPNYLLYLNDSGNEVSSLPNDPYLRNEERYQWSLFKTNVLDAWENPYVLDLSTELDDSSPTVAVLDTGANLTHEDLSANLDVVRAWDVSQNNNRALGGDVETHGTMVAGFVSAVANNGIGVAGAANNRVRVLPIRVMYLNSESKVVGNTKDVIEGIELVVKYKQEGANIQVLNLSLGGYFIDETTKEVIDYSYEEAVNANKPFHDAIVAADKAEILVVCAAGNEGAKSAYKNSDGVNCFSFPSDYEEVVSVTSTNINDQRVSSSSYNQYKDIAAPGNLVRSTHSNGGYYGDGGGTSYAAPLVASTAAMLFGIDETLTNNEVKEILYETTVKLPEGETGRNDEYGYGRIDVAAAINALTGQLPIHINSSEITVDSVDHQNYTGLEVKPSVCLSYNSAALVEGIDYTLSYANNVDPTNGGASVLIEGIGSFGGTKTIYFSIVGAKITSEAHVQTYGWMEPVENGGVVGTVGQGKRMEALKVNLVNNTGYAGGIVYYSQIQTKGWESEKERVVSTGDTDELNVGELSGTSGEGLRLETFCMKLTGELENHYDIYYRTHIQSVGWMSWARNGELAAGSVQLGLRMEALQILLLPKGEEPPSNTFGGITTPENTPIMIDASLKSINDTLTFSSVVHVQSIGNQSSTVSTANASIGTTGQGLRLEALTLDLLNFPESDEFTYEVHVQTIGWQGAVSSGSVAGTEGRSLRLEALRINLTGELADQFDVYYRTHIQRVGWTGWAKTGQSCGSSGHAYRMEAMQIIFIPKNTVAPGLNTDYFYAA